MLPPFGVRTYATGRKSYVLRYGFTSQQVADSLGVKIAMVEKWRNQNRGPAFVRIGGLVRYQNSAIHDYLRSRTVSTNDAAA